MIEYKSNMSAKAYLLMSSQSETERAKKKDFMTILAKMRKEQHSSLLYCYFVNEKKFHDSFG